MYGISNTCLEAILKLFSRVLPKGHCIPDSLDKVQKVVRDLGLDYVKIHACKNDCVLFFRKMKICRNAPHVGSLGGKLSRTPPMVLLSRNGFRSRSYTTSLLFLDYKECICRRAHRRTCNSIRKRGSMIGKCVTLLTRRHGSTWITNIGGLKNKLVMLGWVLLLMASTPLGCKVQPTPYGLLS